MVTNEDDMLRSFQDRNKCFWFCGLCGLIYQDLRESELLQPSIECGNASRTYDLSILKDLLFCQSFQVLQLLVFLLTQIALLLLLSDEFLHDSKGPMIKVLYLLVQGEVIDIGADRLSRASTEAHYLDTCVVDLIGKLINCDV